MTMTIAKLPNTLTLDDKAFLRYLMYGRNLTNTLYGRDGDSYEQDPSSVALLGVHGDLFIDQRKAYTYCDENQTFTNIETGVVHSLSNHICIIDTDSNETKTLSLDFVSPVPCGKLFEQYKSELVIAPCVANGEFNFVDEGVADILQNRIGINHDGLNSDIAAWEGYYLIYHPVNYTYVCYVPESQSSKYDVNHLNEAFDCDSLDVALMMSFDWATTECDYQLNDELSMKEL